MAADPVVSIEFGKGLDTKTDPKVTAKPVLIQDGIFTNLHRISKRNGYDNLSLSILGGGTISSPTMCKSYKNELVVAGTTSGGAANGNRLFSYSPSLGKWVDKGKYNSVAVSKQIIASPQLGFNNASSPSKVLGTQNPSSANVGNITAVSFESQLPSMSTPGALGLFVSTLDNQTGTTISLSQVTSSYGFIWGFSKIVALGSSLFAVFYIADVDAVTSTTPKLCYQTISVTNAGVTFGAEVQLIVTLELSGSFSYDVASMSTGCFVAVAEASNAFEVYKINTAGAVTASGLVSTSSGMSAINITLDPTQTNAWVYYRSSSAVHYSIYNATTLASVLSDTAIVTGQSNLRHVLGVSVSATQQTVLYSTLLEGASSLTIGVYSPVIVKGSATLTGTVNPGATTLYGMDIYSKSFVINGVTLLGIMSYSQTSPVGMIIDLSDNGVVAKFLPGAAEGVYAQGGNTANATYSAPSLIAVRSPGFLNNLEIISSTKSYLAAGFVVSLSEVVQSSAASLSGFPESITSFAQMGMCRIGLDFNNIDANQGVIQQDTLLLNGGVVSQYDGGSVTELGFTVDPDNISLKGISSGGSIGNGGAAKYVYYVVYAWTDANGNLHQSAPSLAAVVNFTSGSTNSVNVGFPLANVTQKTNVAARIYRTIANGTIPYLSQEVTGTFGAYFIVTDTISDASLQLNSPMYTEGSSILENIAPPPAMVMWTRNNRAWCVDSENPETLIEYTKTASQGSGVSFSTGQLEYVVDSKHGAITGGIEMDEKSVILKQTGVGYFIGDGANDAGNGSTLSAFQFVPSDTGCSNSGSVVSYPGGIIFRATDNKGIYQVSRGTQVTYFGYEVEAYNSQDIRSALIVSNRNQIRFLTSSGSSLLYDYTMGQWSVFSNHAGLSSDTFNGKYTYVRTDGSVYTENATSFLDNTTPYALSVKLQFIKAQSIQNFQRMKRVAMLGDYQNGSSAGHGVQISAAYDFGTTFSATIPYLFGASSTSGAFQYRERLPIQKCDSIQLYIQEIVTGASGEFIDFTDLGIEIVAKRGLNKLPGIRSVG